MHSTGHERDPAQLENLLLAVLFAADEPLSARRMASIVGDASPADIRTAVESLKGRIEREFPTIALEAVAGGFQLATNPKCADYIARIYSGRRKQRLSKAAMETLAIISYKQPITRADIENIRGVGCGGVVTTLMERNLIRIVGKAKVLGAPFLYGTTTEFLEYLGLNTLRDLPSMEELELLLEHEEANQPDETPSPEAPPGGEAGGDDAHDDGDDARGSASVETFPSTVPNVAPGEGAAGADAEAPVTEVHPDEQDG